MDVPWDKGLALDQIAAACISGDFEAARLGWLRLTEAGTNASYAKFAKMVIELRALRADQVSDVESRMEQTASMEHNLGLIIAQAEIEQADTARIAARMALAEVALEEMALTVKALLARVKVLEGKIG